MAVTPEEERQNHCCGIAVEIMRGECCVRGDIGMKATTVYMMYQYCIGAVKPLDPSPKYSPLIWRIS